MTSKWPKRLLPPAIILGCGLAAGGLISMGGSAVKTAPDVVPTPVQILTVQPEDTTASVRATGIVKPARQISLVPQVPGRITQVSDNLVPGGRVSEGELLAMIEQRDTLAAHAQAQFTVRQAELSLALEQGRAATAVREWEVLSAQGLAPERTPLAKREPQLQAAEAQLRAAQAGLRQAEGNLARTRLKAPFNAVVVAETLDVGQVVGPGGPVATLVGTDELWVTVSVPLSALEHLALPSGASPGSPVSVEQRLGEGKIAQHQGRLLRLGGQLDPQTRQAQLTVAVDHPFDPVDTRVPLLPGTHVEVAIQGRRLPSVFRIPRSALHDGKHIWVVTEDALEEREVVLSSSDNTSVLIAEGLSAGDQLVTSPLSLPVNGQLVQVLPSPQLSED